MPTWMATRACTCESGTAVDVLHRWAAAQTAHPCHAALAAERACHQCTQPRSNTHTRALTHARAPPGRVQLPRQLHLPEQPEAGPAVPRRAPRQDVPALLLRQRDRGWDHRHDRHLRQVGGGPRRAMPTQGKQGMLHTQVQARLASSAWRAPSPHPRKPAPQLASSRPRQPTPTPNPAPACAAAPRATSTFPARASATSSAPTPAACPSPSPTPPPRR